VFVHGLHGDQAPWTSETNVFWPESLLPTKASDARILSFEYKAAIGPFFLEEDEINDISNDLINELMDHRTEKEKVAPSRSPSARLIYQVDRQNRKNGRSFLLHTVSVAQFWRTYVSSHSLCVYDIHIHIDL
jgi:hypothetical protein